MTVQALERAASLRCSSKCASYMLVGFSKNERKMWRVHIFQNLTNAFQIILDAMEEQDTEFEDDDNYVSRRELIDVEEDLTGAAMGGTYSFRPRHWTGRCHAISMSTCLLKSLGRQGNSTSHAERQRVRAAMTISTSETHIPYDILDIMLIPSSFFEDIERMFEKNYLPTDQDILRTRLRTTGISETVFDLRELDLSHV